MSTTCVRNFQGGRLKVGRIGCVYILQKLVNKPGLRPSFTIFVIVMIKLVPCSGVVNRFFFTFYKTSKNLKQYSAKVYF